MNNWQRKSEYLLREYVKFKTYADSLNAAAKAKEEVMTRRAEREAAKSGRLTPVAKATFEMEDADDTPTAMEFLREAERSRDVTPRASQVPSA